MIISKSHILSQTLKYVSQRHIFIEETLLVGICDKTLSHHSHKFGSYSPENWSKSVKYLFEGFKHWSW